MNDVAKKLDAYEALSPEDQMELGKALYDLTKQKGWAMFQALLRSTKANAAIASLSDKERPREFYAGMVEMIDLLNVTINLAIANAEEAGEKAQEKNRRGAVMQMLRPGGGSL